MVHLDNTNLRLVELLQAEARTSVIDLARAVDRAESTVRERIAGLERDGVLRGYRALVDPEKLGLRARAVVRADCDRRRVPEVAKRLAAIPNVVSATLSTGARPLTIEILAESMPRLEQVLEERIAPLELEDVEVDLVLRHLVEPRPPALLPGTPAQVEPAEFPLALPLPGARQEPRRPLALPSAR
jgi:DNA-binding Lrp family transcriptional regulator